MTGGPSWVCLRATAGLVAARRLTLRTEGLEHVPPEGPALLVCRHYHHLYDGCALLAAIPRPLGIVVGLDWVQRPGSRLLMEFACRAAGWPVVLRAERLQGGPSAYRPEEARRYLRSALRGARSSLAAGGALAIFPEGYPIIDPHPTPRPADQDLLPFRPGFLHLVEIAQHGGQPAIPIIPVGVAYRPGSRWQVTLRLGSPVFHRRRSQRAAALASVELAVRQLSGLGETQCRKEQCHGAYTS
jgi:1-acyl-sn-glycerol-3-phosphate acyltransferase